MTIVGGKMKIVALEEHFMTGSVLEAWSRLDADRQDLAMRAIGLGDTGARLTDFHARRIADMDAAGIDVQVLSFLAPGLQNLDAGEAVALQAGINDDLAQTMSKDPERLQGFATLATPEPKAAARELERCVQKLGMNGAMLFGRTGEQNADHVDFWPIYEAAEALRAPLYLHPQSPPPAVRAVYYDELGPRASGALATFGLGWHYDAGLQLLRMMIAGVFDRFPDLQIISGHWGEVVLFYADRIDKLAAELNLAMSIGDYFRRNVLVTPGGILSHRYLDWTIDMLGVDRILFAMDYPFELGEGGSARRFLTEARISNDDRGKIAHGNWNRICAAIRR